MGVNLRVTRAEHRSLRREIPDNYWFFPRVLSPYSLLIIYKTPWTPSPARGFFLISACHTKSYINNACRSLSKHTSLEWFLLSNERETSTRDKCADIWVGTRNLRNVFSVSIILLHADTFRPYSVIALREREIERERKRNVIWRDIMWYCFIY